MITEDKSKNNNKQKYNNSNLYIMSLWSFYLIDIFLPFIAIILFAIATISNIVNKDNIRKSHYKAMMYNTVFSFLIKTIALYMSIYGESLYKSDNSLYIAIGTILIIIGAISILAISIRIALISLKGIFKASYSIHY